MKKMIVMTVLMALTTVNAMASVKCFLGVPGAGTQILNPCQNCTGVLLVATVGNIKATAILDIQDENNIQQLSIEDSSRGIKVTAGDLPTEKQSVDLNYYVGNDAVTLMCGKK